MLSYTGKSLTNIEVIKMPSINISHLKVKPASANKFKAMAKSMGITQIALFDLLVSEFVITKALPEEVINNAKH